MLTRRFSSGAGSRIAPSLKSLLLALALAGGSVCAMTSPASAATCKGTACTGQSPVTAGCDSDARLLEEVDETGLSLRFFYSGTCDASWAKVTLDTDYTLDPQAANIFYVPPLGGSEASYSTGYIATADVAKATPMVGGDSMAKGCVTELGQGFDPAPETWKQQGTSGDCTQWH
ncbi:MULTISPECIES: DUF2690 domain-containing protein [Streptomyces]|uniref:DUF2690 domain-containing protein n=1 Tax=Streptomyces TaxID=1883 RepID=UPI001487EC54|nr:MULTISPECIES: DUF2690 domain-containing protein [Streptomyces]